MDKFFCSVKQKLVLYCVFYYNAYMYISIVKEEIHKIFLCARDFFLGILKIVPVYNGLLYYEEFNLFYVFLSYSSVLDLQIRFSRRTETEVIFLSTFLQFMPGFCITMSNIKYVRSHEFDFLEIKKFFIKFVCTNLCNS